MFCLLVTGCASIVTDGTKTINVMTTNNAPASITVDGKQFQAPGPVTVEKDGTDKLLVADGANCKGQAVANRKIETMFWGNIIFGGFFGSTTDNATGKMWTYDDTVLIACQAQ